MRNMLVREKELVGGSLFFDGAWYLTQYPDVAAAGVDPLEHYMDMGWREQRDPGPRFNAARYLELRSDVAAAGVNPLLHFLRHGIAELDQYPEDIGIDLSESLAQSIPKKKHGPKAVFVTHDMNIGGAPMVLAAVARWFQQYTDYDVHIVSMGGGPFAATFMDIAPLHIVGHSLVNDGDVIILKNALRDFLIDEPAFTFINSVASGSYCKIDPFRSPVIAYVHEMPQVVAHFPAQAQSLFERADYVLCGGEAVFASLSERSDMKPGSNRPPFIARPAKDRYLSSLDKKRLRAGLKFQPEVKLVVACGVAHWRKQPDVFVRMAARLAIDRERNVHFAWIGDGEDIPMMKDLAATLSVADKIDFLGNRDDFREIIAASDVFALTSVEDPFPLVCLEAGASSTPAVVFREATGFTSIIEPEGQPLAGLAVTIGDNEAYFDAVDHLLQDDGFRSDCARMARARVLARHTTDAACAEILALIRDVAKLRPRVSIVLPNYNCGPYLKARLDSITAQGFRDYELLLLDDGSSDGSEKMLSEFAAENPLARTIFATTNGGSVFKAWQRGIELATGDIIWITEADDLCEPTFLELALRSFAPSGVRLVHGRSIPIGTDGEISGDWNDLYLDRIAPNRWQRSFCEPAAKEVRATLGRANTIPNASAVLVRREAAKRAISAAVQFKLAGDWAFYLAAINGGRIAYCHEAVNFHRRHTKSVTVGFEGTRSYFQELANVGALVDSLYGIDAERISAFRVFIEAEAERFGYEHDLPKGKVPQGFEARHPGVIFGVGDLSGGGAQMFAIRFVNRWNRMPAPSMLLVAGYEANHPASISQIDSEIAIVGSEDIIAAGGLTHFMRDWGIDIIVTGHWWADTLTGRLIEEDTEVPPWVIVMHGCYESVLKSPDAFPDRDRHFARAERYCAHWIWTAPKNKLLFEQGHVQPRALTHIVNGFEPVSPSGMTRADLGIDDSAVVFTLASRAIAEKGWGVTVDAFRELRAQYGEQVVLLLIGNGPMAEIIGSDSDLTGIRMIAHTARLADYIAVSDVCVLPSWFVGESLPLVLIEFLAQGKPAIVSDIGMCNWAIENANGESAGIVLTRDERSGEVRKNALKIAMATFVDDIDSMLHLRQVAFEAFEKFDMDEMIGTYLEVFDSVIFDILRKDSITVAGDITVS
jgi:glycosyltransferase involved in cell wall biosynthesis